MLPDILRLEETCFSAPWTRKMMEAELTGNPFAHFLVARDPEGAIVGYHCFWIVFEELRLMNLAVCESMRRKGIARALVTEALRMGLAQAATRAVLEVRASNQAALTLYRLMGFVTVSRRPAYYSHPVEDAVIMEMEPLVLHPASSHGPVPGIGGESVSAH
jgi:[ribosomal protein S18]-alanine N-acetyltransferase